MKKRLATQGFRDQSRLPEPFYFTTMKQKRVPVRDAAVDWAQSFKEKRLVRTATRSVPVRERKTTIVFADPLLRQLDVEEVLGNDFIKSFEIAVVQVENGQYLAKTINQNSNSAKNDFRKLILKIPTELRPSSDVKVSELPCAKDQIYWLREMADFIPLEEASGLRIERHYPSCFESDRTFQFMLDRGEDLSYFPRIGIGANRKAIEGLLEKGRLKADGFVLSLTDYGSEKLEDYGAYFEKMTGLNAFYVSFDAKQFQKMLDESPNLRTVEIDCKPGQEQSPEILISILNKPSIQRLEITGWSRFMSDALCATSPTLRYLKINCPDWNVKLVLDLLEAVSPHIEELDLESQHMDAPYLKHRLASMQFPKLRSLRINSGCEWTQIADRAPQLNRLVQWNVDGIQTPKTALMNLKYWEFSRSESGDCFSNKVFSARAIREFVDCCPHLEELHIEANLSDARSTRVGSRMRSLTHLKKLFVKPCDSSSESPLMIGELLRNATQLRTLNLTGSYGAAVDLKGVSFPRLQHLSISDWHPEAVGFAVQLLKGAAALETCELILVNASVRESYQIRTELTCLKALKIRLRTFADSRTLVDLINQAPKLESLTIIADNSPTHTIHLSNPLTELRKLRMEGSLQLTNKMKTLDLYPDFWGRTLDLPAVTDLRLGVESLKLITDGQNSLIDSCFLSRAKSLRNVTVMISRQVTDDHHVLYGKLNSAIFRVLLDAPWIKGLHVVNEAHKDFYSMDDVLPSPKSLGIKRFSLESLTIGGRISAKSLKDWMAVMPELSSLVIENGTVVCDDMTTFEFTHGLKKLVFKNCIIQVDAISGIGQMFIDLHELRFEGNSYMSADRKIMVGECLNKWRAQIVPELSVYDLNSVNVFRWDVGDHTFKLYFENAMQLESDLLRNIGRSGRHIRELQKELEGKLVASPIQPSQRRVRTTEREQVARYRDTPVATQTPFASNLENVQTVGVPSSFSNPEDQRMTRMKLTKLQGEFFDVRELTPTAALEMEVEAAMDLSGFGRLGTITLQANKRQLLPVPDRSFEKTSVVGLSETVSKGKDEFGQTWVLSPTAVTLNYAVESEPEYSYIWGGLRQRGGLATVVLKRLVAQDRPLSPLFKIVLDYITTLNAEAIIRYFSGFKNTQESTQAFLSQNRSHIQGIQSVLRELKIPEEDHNYIATYLLALATKRGSCSNRSVLCAWVMREIGVDMVMPMSGVHRWVALRQSGELVPIDLGGIPMGKVEYAAGPEQETNPIDSLREGGDLSGGGTGEAVINNTETKPVVLRSDPKEENSLPGEGVTADAALEPKPTDPLRNGDTLFGGGTGEAVTKKTEAKSVGLRSEPKEKVDEVDRSKIMEDYMKGVPVWSGKVVEKQLLLFETPVSAVHAAAYVRMRTQESLRLIRSANELKELYPIHATERDSYCVVLDIVGMSVGEQLDSLEHLEMLREYSPIGVENLRIIIPANYRELQQGDCSIQRRLFGTVRSKAVVPERVVGSFEDEVKSQYRELTISDLDEDDIIIQAPEYGPLPTKGMHLDYKKKGRHQIRESEDPIIVTFTKEERERALEKLGASVLESPVSYSFLDGEAAIRQLMSVSVDETMTAVPEDVMIINQETRFECLDEYYEQKSKGAARIHVGGRVSAEHGKVLFIDTRLSHFDFLKLLRIADKNGHRLLIKDSYMRAAHGLNGELGLSVPNQEQEEAATDAWIFVGPGYRSMEPRVLFKGDLVTATVSSRIPRTAALGRLALPQAMDKEFGEVVLLNASSHLRHGWEARSFGDWLIGRGYSVIAESDWEADTERVEMLFSVASLRAKRQNPFLFDYNRTFYRATSPMRLACALPQNPSTELADRFGSLWASIRKHAVVHNSSIDIELLLSRSNVGLWLPMLESDEGPPHKRLLEDYDKREQRDWSFTRWVSHWTLNSQADWLRSGLMKSVNPKPIIRKKVNSSKVHPMLRRKTVLSRSQVALHGQLRALLLQARQQDTFFKLSCPMLYIEGESGLGKSYVSRVALQEQGYQVLTGKNPSHVRVTCPAFYREMTPLHPEFSEHLTEAMEMGYPVIINEINIVSPECLEWLYKRLVNREYATGFCLIATGNTANGFSGRNQLHKGIEEMAMRAGISLNESELEQWVAKMQSAHPGLDMEELRENALFAWRKEFLFSTPPPVYIMDAITRQVQAV